MPLITLTPDATHAAAPEGPPEAGTCTTAANAVVNAPLAGELDLGLVPVAKNPARTTPYVQPKAA